MKTFMWFGRMLAGTAVAAGMACGTSGASGAQSPFLERDDEALLEWNEPSQLEVWAGYGHVLRPVEPDGAGQGLDWALKANIGAAGVDWCPAGWFSLGAFGGGAEAKVAGPMRENGDFEAGGGAQAGLNFWQIGADHRRAAWDVTFRAEGRVSWWQSGDDGQGEVQWMEWYAGLPVRYKLAHPKGIRGLVPTDFRKIGIWAGPAFSGVDGTWKRHELKEDFSEEENFGVVGGAEMWIVDSLRLWGRLDWFGDAGFWVGMTYEF